MESTAFTIWLTGLPCSGKTTIATALEGRIRSAGFRVELLDGDSIRKMLSNDIAFSRDDRSKHLQRVAFVCALLNKHGVNVIASFVSPYRDV